VCSEEEYRRERFGRGTVSRRRLEALWSRFPSEASTRRRFSTSALGVASVLLLVCAAGVWLARRGQPGASQGDQTLRPLMPAGELASVPRAFRFGRSGAAASAPVRVVVFDTLQSYGWTSDPTQSDRVAFPEAERRRLSPEVVYFWTILADGRSIPAVTFRWVPDS